MPKATREKALADKIASALDTLDFNYAHCMFAFNRHGSAVQHNLFELILTFLNRWAALYDNGDVEPEQKLYHVCLMSSRMIRSLDA